MTTYTWIADPDHTQLEFSVRHNQISKVTGQFLDFDIRVTTTQPTSFEQADIQVAVRVRSLDTGQLDRDSHLQGDDFFRSAQFPLLSFHAQGLQQVEDNLYKLQGQLSLLGHSATIVLDAELNGLVEDFEGDVRAGFTLTGSLDRHALGLTWDGRTPDGQPIVGDKVQLGLDVELVRQPQ